jgi:hypothetical protein
VIALVMHFAINGMKTSNVQKATPAQSSSLHRLIQ